MTRCDFCSIINLITEYISEAKAVSQTELLFQLFNEFANENDDFDFDQSRVNRWFKGKDPISPTITRFYLQDGYAEYLASDLEEKVFPLMTDFDKAAQEIYDLLMAGKKLTKAEEQKVKLSAKNLFKKLTEEKQGLLVVDWYKDEQPRAKVKAAIELSLDKDLPDSYDKDSFRSKAELLLNHFIDMAVQGYGWVSQAA